MFLSLLLCATLGTVWAQAGDLTTYTPIDLRVPAGAEAAKMQVMLPNRGEHRPSNPSQLMAHVGNAWEAVVEKNQAGLVDAKHTGPMAPLSASEAWHHFQANENGVVDSGRFLIAFGMIPSVQSGGSPLHIAAAMGHPDEVRRLVDQEGVDVDLPKGDGTTALHAAATMGHRHVVEVLVEFEANLEATGNNGATALMMAAAMGHERIAEALLDAGADANRKHRFGGTSALHFAAEMGRVETIELLCR